MLRARCTPLFRTAIAGALACGLAGCPTGPEHPTLAVKPPPYELLESPEKDAASLLGRAVLRAAGGRLTIADARAPGCDVRVERDASTFHESYVVDAQSMWSIAGGIAKVASLDAKYGAKANFSVVVDNTSILNGNLSGACSGTVIDKVYVGRGSRQLASSSQAGVNASVPLPGSPVQGGWNSANSAEGRVDWSDEEGYGFRTREITKTESLDVRAQLVNGSIMTEGDELRVKFDAPRQGAWLVVFYVNSLKRSDLLWPSNEEPEPYVAPGQTLMMPSPRETARNIHYLASLPKPGEPSREMLVVFAFADKGDFDIRKPSATTEDPNDPGYERLAKELRDVPMTRWSRTVVEYVIQPKTPAAGAP